MKNIKFNDNLGDYAGIEISITLRDRIMQWWLIRKICKQIFIWKNKKAFMEYVRFIKRNPNSIRFR